MNIVMPKQFLHIGSGSRRIILGLFAVLLITWVIWFSYSNWYRVVVRPPELSPASLDRNRTKILTTEFAQFQEGETVWQTRPQPGQIPNVFDPGRSTPNP